MEYKNKRYVLDANVFLEYILGRKHQNIVKKLISKALPSIDEFDTLIRKAKKAAKEVGLKSQILNQP